MVANDKRDVLLLLDKLIKHRSDSFTVHEKAFEAVLLDEIKNLDYFVAHPDHFGASSIAGDDLGRSVIWALHHEKAEKTVILFGHHDTVDASAYGTLEPYDSNSLKLQLSQCSDLPEDLQLDLDSDEWIWGRGACDMKAGLAIHLQQLKEATQHPKGVNLLWISVPDEEYQSLGMRHATHVLLELKKQFSLNYELALLSEPHQREMDCSLTVSTGSVGKMMPMIVSKGIAGHSGIAYSGLSSVSIAMEVIKAIELNTEMGDTLYKKMTPPPAFLGFKTIKTTYDVTTPEFTVGYFNWLFLKENLKGKFEQLKELCKWSMEDAINQFNYSYNEYLRKQGLPSYEDCMCFDFEILLYDELVEKVVELKGLDVKIEFKQFKEQHFGLDEADLTAAWIMYLMNLLNRNHPMIVIGLLPPFYPVVDSGAYFETHLREPLEKSLQERGNSLITDRYFMGISDMSYMKKMKHDPSDMMKQMPLYQNPYHIDFEAIERLDVEVLHLGPWGKDLHKKTERVYREDVVETIPRLMNVVFNQIKNRT